MKTLEEANSSGYQLTNSNDSYHCSKALDEAFLIVYAVLGLAILVGNTFCCVVFLATPKLRRCYMNIFLVSLGFGDIFVAIFVIPGHCAFCTSCSKEFILHNANNGTCGFLDAVKDYVWLASVYSLLGITYDRYVAVIHPLRYQCKITPRTVLNILSTIWLLPILFSFIKPILNAANVDFLKDGSRSESIFDMVVVSAMIILPMAILFIVNIMITKAIRNQHRKVQCERKQSKGDLKPKESRRKTISCLIVVLIFLVCWFPRCLLNFLFLFQILPAMGLRLLEKISLVFLFVQSSANPFLYSLYRRDYRRAAKSFLHQLLPFGSSVSPFVNQVRPRLDTEASSRMDPVFSNCQSRRQSTVIKLQEM